MKSTFIPNAPEWFWDISEEARKEGRCGPGHGIGEKLVPETIWGMSYTDCCQVHDMDYSPGWNPDIQEAIKLADPAKKSIILLRIKDEGDDRFLRNMLNKIELYSANGFMRWIRNMRAMTTYNAVSIAGKTSFWNNVQEYEENI